MGLRQLRQTTRGMRPPERKGPPERPMVPKASGAFRWQLPCRATPVHCTQTGRLLQGLMLALHWPLDPGLWTLAFGPWPRRALVAIGTGRFRRSSLSARDGARTPLNQPMIIQQPIRRIVQTAVGSFSTKFRSPRLSKHARSSPAELQESHRLTFGR